MKAGIYLITSPIGRRYVGQAVDLEKRMNKYKGLHCKEQPYLYNSLKKHGFEQHKITFLFECNFDDFEREFLKDLLNDLETEFILVYKTFIDYNPKGMNLTTGGGVCVVSEQTKIKMSESMKIANKKPEVKAKRSKFQKEFQNRPEERAKRSEFQKEYCNRPEVRARISAATSGDNNPLRKRNLKRYNEKLQRLRECKDIYEPLNVPRIIGIQSSIF